MRFIVTIEREEDGTYKEGHPATLSIPSHPEVARGTLRALVRAAGLHVEDVLRD